MKTVAQISQGYNSLIAPGAHFGLGRINNYIQDLYMGVSTFKNHYEVHSGIIPNSDLVLTPSITKTIPQSTEFRLQLFMNPSTTTFAIIAVLIVIVGILSVIIYILQVYEWREDESEKRSRLHELNFDAL